MNLRICSILLLILSAPLMRGQESPLLNEYRRQALDYNQEMRVSEKNILLSRESVDAARADYKPKLAAGANFNYTGNPMELTLALPTMENPIGFTGRNLAYGASLSLTQPLYTGGRLRETVRMAEREGSLAVNQSQVVRSAICTDTDTRYWTLVARRELLTVAEAYRNSILKLTEVVRQRVEVSLIDRSDLLMTEVKLNEADYRLEQAKSNFEVARMSLNSLLGVPFDQVLPTDTLVPPILTVEPLGERMGEGKGKRAELRMAQDRIDIQHSAKRLTNSKYLPQISLGAEGSYGSPGYNFKADLDPNYAVYAKLSVPLFEWGKRGSERRAADYRIDMAKERFAQTIDRIDLEIQSVYYSYSQAVNQVSLTESSLRKAEENERLALERYREGRSAITEVIDAQLYNQAAQLNYVQSRMTAQLFESEFKRVIGEYQY